MVRMTLALIFLIPLTGCMSMARSYVMSTLKKAPVYEHFYIHPGAEVGDTALYTSENKQTEGHGQRVRLIAKENGLNVVSIGPSNTDLLDFKHLLWVTDEGNVVKAQLVSGDDVFPIRVEGADPERGYFRKVTFEGVAVPQRVEIRGRVYEVSYIETRQVMHNHEDLFIGTVSSDMTHVAFYDPTVPFGKVKTVVAGKTKKGAGAFDFIDVAIKAGNPDLFSSKEVLNDMLSTSKADDLVWKMEFNYTVEDPPEAL